MAEGSVMFAGSRDAVLRVLSVWRKSDDKIRKSAVCVVAVSGTLRWCWLVVGRKLVSQVRETGRDLLCRIWAASWSWVVGVVIAVAGG